MLAAGPQIKIYPKKTMDDTTRAQERANLRGLSAKWRDRFVFFELYGSPNSKEGMQALRRMPWGKRGRIARNWWAFWFAPIYLCALGLWRKVVVLWGGMIAADICLTMSGIDTTSLFRSINLACGVYFLSTANYAYYQRKVHGARGWNPFSPH